MNSQRAIRLCIFVVLWQAWPHLVRAALVDGLQVKGNVVAENHIFFTGSPNVSEEVLKAAFIEGPTAPPGGLCPLKNRGDRNCDGKIGNDDLAFFLAEVGPLVQHGEPMTGFTVGNPDVKTNEQYFYVAAWAETGNSGIAVDLDVFPPGREFGFLKSNAVTIGNNKPGGATTFVNWQACASGVFLDERGAPDRLEILGAIEACDNQTTPLGWVAPSFNATGPVSLPPGFNSQADWFWAESAGVNEIVLLRHGITGGKTPLSLTELDLGDSVQVTVDPMQVGEYQLDLEFDASRFAFQRIEGVAPYTATISDIADGLLVNINGAATRLDEVAPIEVDIFRVTFRKNDPTDTRPNNFRVFASDDDFVRAVNPETQEIVEFTGSQIKQAAVGPLFSFDLNRDDLINGADIDIACNEGDILTPWLDNLGSPLGDIDLDGELTFDDFLVASANVGRLGTYSDGDVDCNGLVEASDAQFILSNVGGAAAAPVVPEPSGVVLLFCGGLLTGIARRQR